ncbi:hypothetical protein B0H10DRAFT_2193226 [Mycena sp. CBHHK59/15]|nr:hypothetical protein B0H10DRAFT_2193226 [Mycena sp. CBHHK59/15]
MPSLSLPPCCTLADAACLSRALHQRTLLHGADAQCCGETQCAIPLHLRVLAGTIGAGAAGGIQWSDTPASHDMRARFRAADAAARFRRGIAVALSGPSFVFGGAGHFVDSAPADVALDDRI